MASHDHCLSMGDASLKNKISLKFAGRHSCHKGSPEIRYFALYANFVFCGILSTHRPWAGFFPSWTTG